MRIDSVMDNTHNILIEENIYDVFKETSALHISQVEISRLRQFAETGYKYADKKREYLEELEGIVSDWYCSNKLQKYIMYNPISIETDINMVYNAIRSKLAESGDSNVNKISLARRPLPLGYVIFGIITFALFCIATTALCIGMVLHAFVINPIYLLMLSIGFAGLSATDLVAIVEWRRSGSE